MSLECARREIRRTLTTRRAPARSNQAQADAAFARIDCATSIEDAARRAHIVMETGPDEAESKLEMFCLLDRICLPGDGHREQLPCARSVRHGGAGGVHRRHVFFRRPGGDPLLGVYREARAGDGAAACRTHGIQLQDHRPTRIDYRKSLKPHLEAETVRGSFANAQDDTLKRLKNSPA